MNLTDIFTGGLDKVVTSVGTTIDNLVTSDEEREALKNELVKIKINAQLEGENNYLKHETEITKRWQSDNENMLTRLVRPSIVIWSYVLITIIILFDGNISDFTVKESYIPILETIVTTVTIAYFGSRGFEKITKKMKE
ncbi:MAG: Unknown protein [uncultured Sulfurovum sp.]|uniref:Holin of 3TMs, for gene-transfer release n=1 Tax=uncultured Sulfurovum sp. TaxID=269237 RepID=A0A6S6SHA1_9BACT|nr:MAG: Unknown protein [uncultured Sulfurovum sp.]